MWIRGGAQQPYWTVWQQPGILALSVVIALVIQRFEAMVLRKKSINKTRQEFQEANSVKKVEADPRAIAVSIYHAKKHNLQGTGSVVGTFVAVVILYGLEIAAFVGSFSGSGSWVINSVYGFLAIGGFEVFDRMGDAPEEDI